MARKVHTVTTKAAMTAIPLADLVDGQQIEMAGYNSAGDGGGGTLFWNAGSTATANGGTVIAHDDTPATGRFERRGDQTVNVKMFGAVGDGAADDTAALRSAIASKIPLWWPNATYRITNDIGQNTAFTASDLYWESDGATVKLDSASHLTTGRMCRVTVTGQKAYIAGLTFDVNLKASIGLAIENNTDMTTANLSDVTLVNTHVTKVRRETGSDVGGDGIFIRGAFNIVSINGSSAKDCRLAASAGSQGIVGIAGFNITHFGNTAFPQYVFLNRVEIEDIYSEDDTYEFDQDGVKVLAPHVDAAGVPVESFLTVNGGKFKNCFGRSIKTQMFFNDINSLRIFRDTGFASGVGNAELDLQIAGSNVSNIDCFYNGIVPNAVVIFGSSDTPGGVDYQKSTYEAQRIQVHLAGATTLDSVVKTFPSDGRIGPVTVKRVDVFGTVTQILEHLINGTGVWNTAKVQECYVKEIAADGTTGNRALVRVRKSGDEASAEAHVTVEDCVYDGSNTAYILEDSVAGTAASAIVSARGNRGFVSDLTSRIDNSGVKDLQGLRAAAFAGEDDGSGIFAVRSSVLLAGTTQTFVVPDGAGGFAMFKASFNGDAVAIFTMDSGNMVTIHAGSAVELGGTTEPVSSGKTFDLWRSAANTLSVKNNDGSNRRAVVWFLDAG